MEKPLMSIHRDSRGGGFARLTLEINRFDFSMANEALDYYTLHVFGDGCVCGGDFPLEIIKDAIRELADGI